MTFDKFDPDSPTQVSKLPLVFADVSNNKEAAKQFVDAFNKLPLTETGTVKGVVGLLNLIPEFAGNPISVCRSAQSKYQLFIEGKATRDDAVTTAAANITKLMDDLRKSISKPEIEEIADRMNIFIGLAANSGSPSAMQGVSALGNFKQFLKDVAANFSEAPTPTV